MTTDTADFFLVYLKTPEDERPTLSPKRGQILKRILSIISLLVEHTNDADVIELHISIENDLGNKISKAVAYRDMFAAKYIHGNMTEINRKYERVTLAELQKKQMYKSLEADDTRGFNMGMKNLITLLQLDKPDPIEFDYATLQPATPIFGFYKEIFTHNDLPESDEEFLATIERLKSPAKFKESDELIDYTEIND
jgi:hypothetical protein